MCNPGGASAILGLRDYMSQLYPGATLRDFEEIVGHELGVVRISLGLASNFHDVWRVIKFASLMSKEEKRRALWERWQQEGSAGIGQAI